MQAESTSQPQDQEPKLPKILHMLMEEMGISEAELARRTQIPQPTLHRILSGATRSPRGESLSPIAKFFSVSISQLIGDEPLPNDRLPGAHNLGAASWSTVPVLTWELASEWPSKRDAFKNMRWTDWTTTDRKISGMAFALRVSGDTMLPRFPEGCMLVAEPNRNAKNRDFVIVQSQHQPHVSFKQLLEDGQTRYLRPLNPEFATSTLSAQDRIVAVVIQIRQDFE